MLTNNMFFQVFDIFISRSTMTKIARYVLNIFESHRKTGFLGFIICIDGFEEYVGNGDQNSILKYLPFYKISQDHLTTIWIHKDPG